jgi:uncharacterized protein YrzB (UPF0473 family)
MSEHCCCGHDHEHEHCHEHEGHALPHEESDDSVITLVDENDVEHEFEIADVLEENGKYYMALIPVFDTAEDLLDDTGELVVLKVVAEGAKEYLEAIEDEEEFNHVSNLFMERLGDEYDFEE